MSMPAAPRAWPLRSPSAVHVRIALEMTTLVLLAVFAWRLVATWGSEWARLYAGGDLGGYLAGARRFVETGSPYLPEQIAGRWALETHSFVHPPAALILFVPFLVLPAVLWWSIPLAITAWALVRLRPARWTWPLLALCLIWPRSIGSLLAGNSDMWVMAIVAAGAVLRWPLALLIVKPTFGPFSLIGFGHRTWLVAHLAVAAGIVATWPMWVDYFAVLFNSQVRLDYSLLNLPLVALPAIAWLGRSRAQAGTRPPAG